MKVHPTKVEGYVGTNEDLAKAVFRLRYDELAKFLFCGMQELNQQCESDKQKGRKDLARLLLLATYKTGELVLVMHKTFNLCKNFMQEELNQEKKRRN